MKVLLIGGTGFIGTNLSNQLLTCGHEVVILTRKIPKEQLIVNDKFTYLEWNLNAKGLLPDGLKDIDAIINLAGESIGKGRWTVEVKDKILNSRVNTTRGIINSIAEKLVNPKVLINASAIGFYGPTSDQILDEASPAGRDFLAEVCKAWEAEAYKAEELGVRVAVVRIGVVLGTEGALQRMIPPFKFYLGGPVGSGKQWLSWIHIQDLVGIISHILGNENIKGVINATSPKPVPMNEFARTLGKVIGKPSRLKVPGFVLQLVLGEMSDLVLNGQRVIPKQAIDSGYRFSHIDLEEALTDILLH